MTATTTKEDYQHQLSVGTIDTVTKTTTTTYEDLQMNPQLPTTTTTTLHTKESRPFVIINNALP